jgi:anhydro-N-acetylmuramic acid kinase
MLYKVIGMMSGSSLDGLDIVYAHFHETAAGWTYEIHHSACHKYSEIWTERLRNATNLTALEYQRLHVAYGHLLGEEVNRFIANHDLAYQVQLIASHGHTSFHDPKNKMTAQLGDGASIAADTGIHVINELRAMDMALGGQGAPIVPIGELKLLGDHDFFLNLGGIANISARLMRESATSNEEGRFVAFDICPANRVLNLLTRELGPEFDEDGRIAASGSVNNELLERLNEFSYYDQSYPKSLANEFGTEQLYPLIHAFPDKPENKICTYVEHICFQVANSIKAIRKKEYITVAEGKLLVTGGGAHNGYMISRLRDQLAQLNITLAVPEDSLIDFKEALVMAFMGLLRWREEVNVLSSVTGATRDSTGGTIWLGK